MQQASEALLAAMDAFLFAANRLDVEMPQEVLAAKKENEEAEEEVADEEAVSSVVAKQEVAGEEADSSREVAEEEVENIGRGEDRTQRSRKREDGAEGKQ